MNKNTVIGLILMGALFVGFSMYNSNQAEKQRADQARVDSLNKAGLENVVTAVDSANNVTAAATSASMDSVAIAESELRGKKALGEMLFAAKQGNEQEVTLSNNKMVVTISNKGAIIKSVELTDYKTYSGAPLYLFKGADSKFNLSFFNNAQQLNSSDFFFTRVDTGSADSVAFRLYADSVAYMQYSYSLKPDANMVDFHVDFVNMESILSPVQRDMIISWSNISPQQERGFSYENQYTTAAYSQPGTSDVEELSMSTKTEEEQVDTKIRWVAFKQQFFSSIFVAKSDFLNGDIKYETMSENSGYIKRFSSELKIPYEPGSNKYDFSFYFGPNSYSTLNDYDENFQKLVPLGWGIFGWINRFLIIPAFNVLGGFMTNYGWIIFLLTLFIKLIIFPFTYKSYISMAKMRLLKPELDELGKKYPSKDDAMKKQQAMLELYRKAGVSPMGGCLPLLLQFPVLIAMFRFFPASIELRGEHFLWANDLSSYDSILNLPFNIPVYGSHVSLFALLMGVSLYVASRINMAQNSAMSSNQMPGMKFMTLYMMPIMMILWFNNSASGLSYYYLLSNLITIAQTYIFRKMINEDKLHAQMKDNAKKPKKKSKFQQRYDDMLRQQQELRKNSKR